jgi:zinc/manganese transport system substrate-binding protein
MKLFGKNIRIAALALFLGGPAWAGPLRVVTTTEDLAALTREIGGAAVDVHAIAKGYQDPHFVEAKPSHLLKMRRAELFIQIGLELEIAWAPVLLNGARNPDILPGGPGFLDVSEGCDIADIPTGPVDRSHGDVHPLGNPHYWTDPENGRRMARSIAERLSALRPGEGGRIAERLADFEKRLDERLAGWKARMAPFQGARIVTYHRSWSNFAQRFGLTVVDFVEPKPGVPPSPLHVRHLIERIRAEKIPVILMEPYFDQKLPGKIARETGATLLLFPPSVGGAPELRTYLDVFDVNIERLAAALEGKAR